MVNVLLLFGNPIDRAAFNDYFERTHRPLLTRLPELDSLRINHVAGAITGESPFYLIIELEFRSEEVMRNGLNSESGKTMARDFSNFASGGVTVLLCNSSAPAGSKPKE
jgi:uncharacterized protein (TIGR02118 family)